VRQENEIEREQQVAGMHAIALARMHDEALASQRNGIDTHVYEDFRAARGAQRHGMT
jgi:hypothetical protein